MVKAWHVSPPVHVQLENPYPEGMLHAVTVADPKSVLKNEPPLPMPGPEHDPQFTEAEAIGVVRMLSWAAYTAIRTPPEL